LPNSPRASANKEMCLPNSPRASANKEMLFPNSPMVPASCFETNGSNFAAARARTTSKIEQLTFQGPFLIRWCACAKFELFAFKTAHRRIRKEHFLIRRCPRRIRECSANSEGAFPYSPWHQRIRKCLFALAFLATTTCSLDEKRFKRLA
jgi:hypothetical protein